MQTGYRREYTDDTSKEDERMAKYKEHRLSDDEEDYENSEVIQEGSASNNIGEAIIYNLQMQLAIMDKVAWINHQMENNERAMVSFDIDMKDYQG